MRCHICDRLLSHTEIVFSKEMQTYEPCFTCLDAALDAAYSGGFVPDRDPLSLDEVGLQNEFENAGLELIDLDFVGFGDATDIPYGAADYE